MDPEKVNYHYCDDLPTRPLGVNFRVLVTGANGYVGRRLIPELLHRGYIVRCMLRHEGGSQILTHPKLEIVYADGSNAEALRRAMEGVDVAYYLIHSLRLDRAKFQDAEKDVARNFVDAANRCGVKKIVYLGGLDGVPSGLNSSPAASPLPSGM